MSEEQQNHQSLGSEIAEGFRTLEQKIEHALGLDGAPSSTELATGNAVGGALLGQQSQDATSAPVVPVSSAADQGNGAPAVEPAQVIAAAAAGDSGNAGAASDGSNASVPSLASANPNSTATVESTAGSAGEQGNVSAAPDAAASTQENATVSPDASQNQISPSINTAAPTGESPNVDASAAAAFSENASASSALPASQGDDTLEASVSVVPSSTIRGHVHAIKGLLLGFEASTVAKIHAELEAIERAI